MRRVIEFVLRLYSYVFAAVSGAAMLALAAVSKLTGAPLTLDALPWKGAELSYWLVGLGGIGLASAVLAAFTRSPLRLLLPLYCVAFACLMVNGNFLMPAKSYSDMADFQQTAWFTAGSVVAAAAALLQCRKKK